MYLNALLIYFEIEISEPRFFTQSKSILSHHLSYIRTPTIFKIIRCVMVNVQQLHFKLIRNFETCIQISQKKVGVGKTFLSKDFKTFSRH